MTILTPFAALLLLLLVSGSIAYRIHRVTYTRSLWRHYERACDDRRRKHPDHPSQRKVQS